MNQAYKKMKFKEKIHHNENGANHTSKKNVNKRLSKKQIEEEKKEEKSLNKNIEDDNISVGNMTGNRSTSADTHNGLGGIRRAATNFGGFKKANSQIKNKAELLIYKDEKFVKQVKIILVGHYIFYYKNNRGNFLYKKIMPIWLMAT